MILKIHNNVFDFCKESITNTAFEVLLDDLKFSNNLLNNKYLGSNDNNNIIIHSKSYLHDLHVFLY